MYLEYISINIISWALSSNFVINYSFWFSIPLPEGTSSWSIGEEWRTYLVFPQSLESITDSAPYYLQDFSLRRRQFSVQKKSLKTTIVEEIPACGERWTG